MQHSPAPAALVTTRYRWHQLAGSCRHRAAGCGLPSAGKGAEKGREGKGRAGKGRERKRRVVKGPPHRGEPAVGAEETPREVAAGVPCSGDTRGLGQFREFFGNLLPEEVLLASGSPCVVASVVAERRCPSVGAQQGA